MSNTASKKAFYFEIIRYILDENQLLEAVQKNSYSVPVLKIIRKRNAYEKENLYFKGFLATCSQYLYSRLFQNSNFLRATFTSLTKIKSHRIKSIGDQKCV